MKKMPYILGIFLPIMTAKAEISGIWQTEVNEEGKALHVEIMPCKENAVFTCGYIHKLINSDKTEIIGKTMIFDMEAVDEHNYINGTIWAPDKDKTYDSSMRLNGEVLEVKGCIMGGIICRGQTWTRVK